MVLALGMGFLGFAGLATVVVVFLAAVFGFAAGAWAIRDVATTKNIISFMFVSCFIYGDPVH